MTNGVVFGNMSLEQFIKLRKAMGFTQDALANEMGMSSRSITEIETGRTELRRMHILAMERIAMHYPVELGQLTPDLRRDLVNWLKRHA